jgi:3-hydroxyisobutyrate dehydrogenase-like beta-hydroxyacid dehydrogenase
MQPILMVVGAGAMGAGVGWRLATQGATVLSPLSGRSEASRARAHAAGMTAVDDARAADAEFILSIVPPGDAVAVARRFAAVLKSAPRKPIYVDCNAVNPKTMEKVAAAIAPSGCPVVDAGIIGGPPREGYKGPTFYVSGPKAVDFVDVLGRLGLNIVIVDGPIGAASAVKMSYAGITKGLTALASAMMLAASRAGTAETLRAELAKSQPALLAWFERQIPQMYPKAYRWIAEMDEIADFVGEDAAAHTLLGGTARLYERLAADFADGRQETGTLEAFLSRPAAAVKAAE